MYKIIFSVSIIIHINPYYNLFPPIQFADVCYCPTLTPPLNSLISGCNGTDIVGDVVEYSCRSGYYLVGANTRTCQTGGNWTGSAPTCEKGVTPI